MPRRAAVKQQKVQEEAAAADEPGEDVEEAQQSSTNIWDEIEAPDAPDAGGIIAHICRGIIHGTVAVPKAKPTSEEDASHKWSCYVRGPDDFDISTYIKQVVFTLHPSFNNAVRALKSPPFEVHEEGWGEFDIGIKLHFWPESGCRPIEIQHQLKLYPNEMLAVAQQPSKKPVVNEVYEELVFTTPDPTFAKRLQTRVLGAGNQSALARYDDFIRPHFRTFDDKEMERQVRRCRKVCQAVLEMTSVQRERLVDVTKEVAQLEADIRASGGEPVKAVAPKEPTLMAPPKPKPAMEIALEPAPPPAPPAPKPEPLEPEDLGRGHRKGRKRVKR